jgi:ribonuclease HI
VHRIVHQATPGANVLIETSNDYIVKSVNTLRLDWRKNRWKNKKGDSVAYALVWKEIDALILQKALEIEAVHIRSEDAKRSKIMIILKDLAQSGREHHGRPPRK